MLKIMILVCASGIAQANCNTESAAAVIQGPDVPNAMMCGLHGQAYLADTALAAYVEDGHYLKLRCAAGAGLARVQEPWRRVAARAAGQVAAH